MIGIVTLEQVISRLSQLGFEVAENQNDAVQFELDLILDYTVNYCNFSTVEDIPEILDKRIIDRVCSEYLLKQKNAGNLDGFDYEPFIKTIKEGDTQIQYGNSSDGETAESRFEDLCNYMQRGYDKWISLWRRIKW